MKEIKTSVVFAKRLVIFLPYLLAFGAAGILVAGAFTYRGEKKTYQEKIARLEADKSTLQAKLDEVTQKLNEVKGEDQYVTNRNLETEIKNIQKTYTDAVKNYEDLLKL